MEVSKRGSNTLRRRLVRGTLVLVVLAVVFVPVAKAFQDYVSVNNYAVYKLLYPSDTALSQNGGLNYRTENNGCRSGNSGQVGVAYWYPDWHGGPSAWGWTNCSTGAVIAIYNNGYYRAGCWNNGTVEFHVYCDSWNYSP